jgi:NAD(P)-dependent dehydrogenase (short-subunit alcohol dehydrogenase family)
MGKLVNKVAVVTGGTSGMALASAKLFVEEGAYVFISGRGQEQLDKAVKEIGKNVTGVQGDAGNLADLDRLFDTVKKQKGHIDILFASAGVGEIDKPIGTITEKGFDDTFNVNVRGALFTVQKALPLFREGGSIILNTSIANNMGFAGASVYGASKAALRSFARTWTAELKDRKIRVNAISPGPIVDTGTFAHLPDGFKDLMIAQVPLGRLGLSKDIASAALFFASDDSSFVTGSELAVDGGMNQV